MRSESNLRAASSEKWGGSRGGWKNARLRAQPLCLSRLRRRGWYGGGRPHGITRGYSLYGDPRAGHGGAAINCILSVGR